MTPEQLRVWIKFGSKSPLYERLVEIIAEDPDLLRVLNRIEHLPQPNLLFAGVQYLLLADPTHALATYYPNLADGVEPRGNLEAVFRQFVLDHEEELVEIGRTRYTQTNECRRCVALLPLIWRTPVTSFHLVDVGASAGLNLHLDRYQYSWGEVSWGRSPVKLVTESRGAPIVPRDVGILTRFGLDLNPVDPTRPDERRWLEALIWPDHVERRERLRAALEVAADHPATFVSGDALETIPGVLAAMPRVEPAVVMHSFTLIQFDPDQRDEFRRLLDVQRGERDVYEIGFEAIDRSDGAGALTIDDGSGPSEVGLAHPHGEWVKIHARP